MLPRDLGLEHRLAGKWIVHAAKLHSVQKNQNPYGGFQTQYGFREKGPHKVVYAAGWPDRGKKILCFNVSIVESGGNPANNGIFSAFRLWGSNFQLLGRPFYFQYDATVEICAP